MKTSGAHSVPDGDGQAASCDAIVAGTSDVCTQWAPSPHAVSVETSRSGGPEYGHIGGAGCAGGGVVPPSEHSALPMSHAPDGMLVSGLMHGAQRSSAAQVSCGKSDSYCLTCGTQTLRQTPSAALSEWAVGESAQTALPHGGSVDGSIGATVGALHCCEPLPPVPAGLSGLPPLFMS